jgi:hypothetical protein
LALGKHTITGMLCAGAEQFHDWSAAYRMFSNERINRDALMAPARQTVLERLKEDEPLVVMMDDTLIRKRGRKIHGTGWKRDPLGPHFCTNFVWGQRFLQISAALPDAEQAGRARGIPVDFVHAPSATKPRKKDSPEAWQEYRRQQAKTSISQVAAGRLQKLRQDVADKQIICAVDGGFSNRTVFRQIPENTTLIGRIRKDARLFAPPDQEQIFRRGRPRWYGEALQTPEQLRQDESLPWQTVKAFAAGKQHQFEIKRIPAVRWIGTGEKTVSVIVIRPLAYRLNKGHRLLYRNPAYLLCTDPNLPIERLLQAYLWRWEIELNFRDEKTVMGAGQAQVRKAPSTETVPALIVAVYALLLLSGTAQNVAQTCLPRPRWQKPDKTERVTTQRMLGMLRTGLWKTAIDTNLHHFATQSSAERTPFYSEKALASAVCYAYK